MFLWPYSLKAFSSAISNLASDSFNNILPLAFVPSLQCDLVDQPDSLNQSVSNRQLFDGSTLTTPRASTSRDNDVDSDTDSTTSDSSILNNSTLTHGEFWTCLNKNEIMELRQEHIEANIKCKSALFEVGLREGALIGQDEALSCAICLCEMFLNFEKDHILSEDELIVRLDICHHFFHKNCIKVLKIFLYIK